MMRLICWLRGHVWRELPLKLHTVGFPARHCDRCNEHEAEIAVRGYSDLYRRD
jgi:hypothetical protein